MQRHGKSGTEIQLRKDTIEKYTYHHPSTREITDGLIGRCGHVVEMGISSPLLVWERGQETWDVGSGANSPKI